MRLLPGSIRGRLLLGLIVVIVGMNVALLSSSYQAARHEINELFDAQLAQSARVLQGMLAGQTEPARALRDSLQQHGWGGLRDHEEDEADKEEGEEATPFGHEYESKIAFQLIDDTGRVEARTRSAPQIPFTDLARGYQTRQIGDRRWRVFVLPLPDAQRAIQVGERMDIRGELEARIAWKTVQKSLYGLPLLALLVWLVVGAGLRPLKRLTSEIRNRRESQLGPIAMNGATRELEPIIAALDSLFQRLRAAWARERRFVDEAAHELRTPLAAMQLYAESLATESDAASREHTIGRLLDASARGSRLASQLLTLARVESNETAVARRPVALAPLLREEAALLAPLAAREGKSVELDADPDLPRVNVEPGLIGLMVRNLVDNAIRYSPPKGVVHIRAEGSGRGVAVLVDDEGPGIPADSRERVLGRFARLDSAGDGSGLGLAISNRIAEQHETRLELLDNPAGQGLRVRVLLHSA